MPKTTDNTNLLHIRVERDSLDSLADISRDLGVARTDTARLALGIGLLVLRQTKDHATRPARVDVA